MQVLLSKAQESLAGAESEFANNRYNNTANRCYYACFQAAIAALAEDGARPPGERWSHRFVPAQFDGQLINRRKLYPAALRGVLARNYALRQKADYDVDQVTGTEAGRAVQRTRSLVSAVRERLQTGGGAAR